MQHTLMVIVCGFVGLSGMAFALIACAIATRRDNRQKRGIEAHLRRY